MGVFAGPNVNENSIVLCLDAQNPRSLNVPSQSDHGYAEWYCLESGTATYSIINSTGGIIYEKSGSSVTAVVTSTLPQRSTISVTAGNTYYGSVPINLVVEDQQHRICPLTMAGTQFWHYNGRADIPPTYYSPTIYYIYSPYQNATVNFYDAVSTGLNGTPTSTITVNAGSIGTISNSSVGVYQWISSNVPVIATVTRNAVDKTILSPMSTYVYQRFGAYYSTANNTTPSTVNSYAISDSTYKSMSMSIADGSGGDCIQGLGLEYLSDTYSWGNVLSDYVMVFPYNATVTVSYWTGNNWVVWETHTVTTGSITNPPRITRDGTNGVGVEASIINGTAANMASGVTLWKWEGTAPFYLAINDSVDDEFSVLGWNSSTQNTPRSGNTIKDLSNRGNNGVLTNFPIYAKNNTISYLNFDGSNDCIVVNNNAGILSTTAYTKIVWFYATSFATTNNLVSGGNSGQHALFLNGSNKLFAGHNGSWTTVASTTTLSLNTWYCGAVTFNTTSGWALYLNGNIESTSTSTTTFTGTGEILIGAFGTGVNIFTGNIAVAMVYNRVLTSFEIQQYFNATRSRFGI